MLLVAVLARQPEVRGKNTWILKHGLAGEMAACKKLLGAAHRRCQTAAACGSTEAGVRRLCPLARERARKLLGASAKVPRLADAVIVETPQLKRWQSAPAQASKSIWRHGNGAHAPPIPVRQAHLLSVARPLQGGTVHRF